MEIGFKKLHEKAVIPSYAYPGDAAVDLVAAWLKPDFHNGYTTYGTGIALEIPEGYAGFIYMRSSVSNKNQVLTNAVGVVDSGFRGEIMFRFKPTASGAGRYEVGDKLGQLVIMPVPKLEFIEKEVLSETVRGTGGYGSSGEKSNTQT